MKRIIIYLLLSISLITAQENLFEKAKTINSSVKEKIKEYNKREFIFRSEQLILKKQPNFKIGYRGVFNIFEKNIKFEISKEFDKSTDGLQGYKAEFKGGYGIITSSNERISVTLWVNNEVYTIENIENNLYFITQKNMEEISKRENLDDIDINKEMLNYDKELFINNKRSTAKPKIRILVVYTNAVLAAYNNNDYNINEQIIAPCKFVTNLAFDNSLINAEVELINGGLIQYQESGDDSTDVHNLKGKNDGEMDIIHTMRTQQKADVCVLIVNTLNTNGRVPDGAIPARYGSAFFVVTAEAAVTNLSFTHELGHLLGGRHETSKNFGIPTNKTNSNDDAPTDFNISWHYDCHGLAGANWNVGIYSGKLKTIMGVYAEQGNDYKRIPYFTNLQIPAGNGNVIGHSQHNNNKRLFEMTIPYVANFESTPFTASISGPTTLAQNQAGVYNCVVEGDFAPYNYQWEIMKVLFEPGVRVDPINEWRPVGANSPTYTKPVPNNGDFRNFKVRCTVRDAQNNFVMSNELYVSYSGQRATNQQTEEAEGLFVEENLLPEKTELLDNYPNPFNPSTTINYKLKESSLVSLKVYDIQGREIAVLVNEEKPAGSYTNVFNASNLASGIYIYKLITKDYSESKKMLLVK